MTTAVRIAKADIAYPDGFYGIGDIARTTKTGKGYRIIKVLDDHVIAVPLAKLSEGDRFVGSVTVDLEGQEIAKAPARGEGE